MMKIHMKAFVRATVVAALILLPLQAASAGTILKLSLGAVGPDLEFSGGVLSTSDDGDAGTTGEQNTAVDFSDFLSGMTDIVLPDASYTLNGVTASGPASVLFGVVVIQPLSGGDFQLWDDTNALLLDVDLGDTALSGPLGPSATGAVFSITNGSVVGGSLAPLIIGNSVSVSISMTNISSGGIDGLSVSPLAPPVAGLGTLNDFTADATKAIAGERVPEPASAMLVILGSLLAPAMMRRRG